MFCFISSALTAKAPVTSTEVKTKTKLSTAAVCRINCFIFPFRAQTLDIQIGRQTGVSSVRKLVVSRTIYSRLILNQI
ncbi:hypothetical protein HMPREF0868_1640 [Mageeibacillus indolicus UPII9-5]|uniref:Uncharacterized protein n=1 Tax=Mageeibacillus indolicus (strain UPII9-5) TaxID=699246 RepID=D3QZJ5_MAGIU|nr:hypothetical protein HMPREF0868_1640 [Mageeibacillus indolicus UPII9-5]